MSYVLSPGYFTQERPEMLAFIPKDSKHILDVGCGAGVFAAQLKNDDTEIWGIEMNTDASKEAAKKLHTVLTGDVNQKLQELPNAYFDCIIFNDILEHLVDPYTVLKNIQTKLNSGGVVIASLPNVRYFTNLFHLIMKKDWQYEESGIRDKTHLRFFTYKSIYRLFEDAGYNVEKFEGINAITSWKFQLFNMLTLGFFSDTRYLQFAMVATLPIRGS